MTDRWSADLPFAEACANRTNRFGKVTGMAASPDGRNLYVGSNFSLTPRAAG